MKKTETEKVDIKREIYKSGAYGLSVDSLNSQIINPEFQAIDQDLNIDVYKGLAEERRKETSMINELLNGKRIILGGF